MNKDCRIQIDNALKMLHKRFENIKFEPKGTSRLEYARLISTLGRGESACMVYCRDNKNVLGSSNLKDIRQYCEEKGITYLTTLDFLYYAFVRGKLSEKECETFINTVIAKGSKLPKVAISHYLPSCQI